MSRGLLFWILMILWVVLSVWWSWPAAGAPYYSLSLPLLLFVLLALLGWKVFGPVLKD